jgi:hypothetical protein
MYLFAPKNLNARYIQAPKGLNALYVQAPKGWNDLYLHVPKKSKNKTLSEQFQRYSNAKISTLIEMYSLPFDRGKDKT